MQLLAAAFDSHWEPLFWFALGVCGAVGMIAIIHPRRIVAVAMREHEWVETSAGAAGADRPANSGFYALTLCRLFGVVVLSAVGAAAYFLAIR